MIQPMIDGLDEDKYLLDVGDSHHSLVSNRQSAKLPDLKKKFH